MNPTITMLTLEIMANTEESGITVVCKCFSANSFASTCPKCLIAPSKEQKIIEEKEEEIVNNRIDSDCVQT